MELEPQIVEGLQNGDQQAIASLYDEYAPSLYGIVLRIVRSEGLAQDVVQDAFVKAWRNGSRYDASKGTLFTWLLNIARNTAIDKTRSLGYQKAAKSEALQPELENDRRFSTGTAIDGIGLREMVHKLEKKYRTVVELAYFQGYTQQEIAAALELPLGTVKSRVRIAVRELRKIFGEQQASSFLAVALKLTLGSLTSIL